MIVPENKLDLVANPDQLPTPPNGQRPHTRLWKRQIWCRRCRREVRRTEQTGLQAGRRIIVCAFYCHGDVGEIRICDDQLEEWMRFEVFDGEPSLAPPPAPAMPALPERAARPDVLDIEAEVLPPPRLTSEER